MFLIQSLEYIVFHTQKLEEMTNYYHDILGLVEFDSHIPGDVWLGVNGSPNIILRKSDSTFVGEVGYTVKGEEHWNLLRERLDEKGISYQISSNNVFGESISFKDVDGHAIAVYEEKQISRSPAQNYTRFGPRLERFQHVTYASPNPMKMAAFYKDVLRFKISDMVEKGLFVWLRTDDAHHTVAAAAHTDVALDHFSFDLPNWESFKLWCDYLGEQNVEVVWGPGRHGPGNNLFIFTIDPDGNRVEYSGEMEKFRDQHMNYQPRVWKESAQTVNLWGLGAPWIRKKPSE